jgi:D-lactate dehydrogenase (cytochrome)
MEFADDEEAMMESIAAVTGIIAAVGGSEDSAWLADTDRERKRLTFFRHAVPEAVNLTIDQRRKELPSITKLGTDMSVPDLQLKRVMTMYRRDLAESGLESVIFGHIGNNHVHVNILPRSVEEFARGKQLYNRWAEQVVAMGGSPAAEHGVGKMKRHFLKLLYGEEGVSQMRLVKELFDPGHLLNRGNWFEQ